MRTHLLVLLAAAAVTASCNGTPGSQSAGGGGPTTGNTTHLLPDAATLTQLSFDPYTNPDGQHQTAMETNIVAHGNTLVAGYHIARLTGGGVTNIGWAVSNDAGNTWAHGALPHTTTVAGGTSTEVTDPVVAYDAKHATWMISFIGLGGPQSAAYVALSHDDGKSWSDPVVIATGPQPDKNWTTCDNFPSSPYYGTCYTEYDEDSTSAVFMSRSTDGGQTWEAPKATADSFAGISGQPTVLPGGKVVVPIANAAFTQLSVFDSTDGGASWSSSRALSDIQTSTPRAELRAEANPSMTIDGTGKLTLVWHDCRFEPSCSQNGLVLSSSSDGATWSAPARINAFPASAGLDQLMPGIGADPRSGRLGMAFYAVSASNQVDAYYSSSSDGGATWSTPFHLGGPMQPEWISTTARGRMIGDYVGVAFLGGIAFPSFSLALQPQALPYDQGVYVYPQP